MLTFKIRPTVTQVIKKNCPTHVHIRIIIKNLKESLIFLLCTEIVPMRINTKKRFLESESEDDLKITHPNFGNIRKRKRIIEIYSSTESESNGADDSTTKILRNKNDKTYILKLRKLQWNFGKNIIPKMEKLSLLKCSKTKIATVQRGA